MQAAEKNGRPYNLSHRACRCRHHLARTPKHGGGAMADKHIKRGLKRMSGAMAKWKGRMIGARYVGDERAHLASGHTADPLRRKHAQGQKLDPAEEADGQAPPGEPLGARSLRLNHRDRRVGREEAHGKPAAPSAADAQAAPEACPGGVAPRIKATGVKPVAFYFRHSFLVAGNPASIIFAEIKAPPRGRDQKFTHLSICLAAISGYV